jgi:hypothetical protein
MKEYFYLNYFLGDDDRIVDASVKFDPAKDNYYDIENTKFNSNDRVDFVLDKSIKYLSEDFFRTTSGEFFGSAAFCNILVKHQPDISLVSSQGVYYNGKLVEQDYFLIHPGKKVDAFDYELSVYSGKSLILSELSRSKKPRLVKGVKKIFINAEKATGEEYFFLANIIYFHPIISGELLSDLRENSINISWGSLGVS